MNTDFRTTDTTAGTLAGAMTPAPLQSSLLSVQMLRQQGWFDSMVSELLPFFDASTPNFDEPLDHFQYYYRAERVLQAEKDPRFEELMAAILAKAARAMEDVGIRPNALQPLASYQLVLDTTFLSDAELGARIRVQAKARYPNVQMDHLPLEVIHRLTVLVLMEEFEPQLWQLEPYFYHPGHDDAMNTARHRLLDAIVNQYPELLEACSEYAHLYRFALNPMGFDEVE